MQSAIKLESESVPANSTPTSRTDASSLSYDADESTHYPSISVNKIDSPLTNSPRKYNTLNFLPDEDPRSTLMTLEENLSIEQQEHILTQEVLHILIGVESSLITVHNVPPNRIGFMVDRRIESSLKDLAISITQLGGYYYTIIRYVENWSKFEHGQVNQALVSGLRNIIKEYFILLVQTEAAYEQGNLSLQKLWFIMQPTLQTFSIISSIVTEIEEGDYRGGKILTLLHEKVASNVGGSTGQNLCFRLVKIASKPYFQILENWIYQGIIKDPFSEFFVTDKGEEQIQLNDLYWQDLYTLKEDLCPSFLKKANMYILKAGKYLNIIRQCGKNVCMSSGVDINYSIHERVYVSAIEKAYSFASKTLLNLLLTEYDLMKHLQSVKHYFLMDKGDFIHQFLDLAESELCKPIDNLDPVRLESLLELALRTSSSRSDPHKDCVRVQLFPCGIGEQIKEIMSIETPTERNALDKYNFSMPVVQGFSFTYDVQWPISLVINRRAIACYQMIFRNLFICKYVERQLCKVWLEEKSSKAINLEQAMEKAAAFSLRQKMLNFVQNLQCYIAFEVIEPSWTVFLIAISKVTNVNQVLECHDELINTILTESMLTNSALLEKITSILSICLQMVKTSSRNRRRTDLLDKKFTKELVEFILDASNITQSPNQSSKGLTIVHRINFNGFYTEALEEAEVYSSLSMSLLRL